MTQRPFGYWLAALTTKPCSLPLLFCAVFKTSLYLRNRHNISQTCNLFLPVTTHARPTHMSEPQCAYSSRVRVTQVDCHYFKAFGVEGGGMSGRLSGDVCLCQYLKGPLKVLSKDQCALIIVRIMLNSSSHPTEAVIETLRASVCVTHLTHLFGQMKQSC